MSAGREVAHGDPKIVGTCATCGKPLTQVGPQGECLRCLVSLGFLGDSRSPERSGVPSRLTPRVLKYDHFEVEVVTDGFPVELGAGAMAITYRARDTVLNSTVALKVIDRKVAENPGARSRFLREARAAAQIHHPNVARVSHYGEQDGECFYVMELVEGETLEQRVRRDGPMPLSLALEITDQVTRALLAAEKCGVVHRDLKPSNIMLETDPSGRVLVKVIDYGVAKVLAPQTNPTLEQTQAGFIGTPAFASPEQFGGSGASQVDTRSDIYSLGVTLWYLLTGRIPFYASSFEELHEKQTGKLPLEQLKDLHIPARCIELLKWMLAPDPKDRPQSARELLTSLDRCCTRFTPEARRRRRRFLLASTASLVVIATIAAGFWFYQYRQSLADREKSIAVLPFEHTSLDDQDSFLTVGMQSEITSHLAGLAGMKVIDAQSTRSYRIGKGRDYHAIARELGVRHLLEGVVSRKDDVMRVSLRLVEPDGASAPWTETYERPVKDVFALQSEITRGVAAQLQTRISPNETKNLDAPPTNDLHAYDLYLEAHALGTDAPETVEQKFSDGKRAIAFLDEATGRDPGFVLAYCELAKWHDMLYYGRQFAPTEDRLIDHRGLAESALEKARRLQPDSGAVHRQLALHALQIIHDPDEAEVQVQLARPGLPNDAELETLAGRVARRQDHWEEAVRCFERAVSLQPRDVPLRMVLAQTYRHMRRYSDHDRYIDSVIALLPPEKKGLLPLYRGATRIEAAADVAPYQAAFEAQEAAHQLQSNEQGMAMSVIALYTRDPAAISRLLSFKQDVSYNSVTFLPSGLKRLSHACVETMKQRKRPLPPPAPKSKSRYSPNRPKVWL